MSIILSSITLQKSNTVDRNLPIPDIMNINLIPTCNIVKRNLSYYFQDIAYIHQEGNLVKFDTSPYYKFNIWYNTNWASIYLEASIENIDTLNFITTSNEIYNFGDMFRLLLLTGQYNTTEEYINIRKVAECKGYYNITQFENWQSIPILHGTNNMLRLELNWLLRKNLK